MGTLAFFPWLPLREPLITGAFELVPYHRSASGEGVDPAVQATCDSVLELYRSSPTISVRRAAILRVAGRGITDQLDDAEIGRVLRWGELVAFCGLSGRRFFDSVGYANRDAFRLVVQSFNDPAQGILMLSRRRDGSRRSFISRSAALFLKAPHVDAGLKVEIEVPLLNGLLRRSAAADWGRFDEAIQLFNSANTDNPDALPETEAVNLVGAFERLFDLSRGKEDELANCFVATFNPCETAVPSSSPRVLKSVNPAKYTKWMSMREVWIRDFFQLRGQHAHGKIAPKMVSLWELNEHLLLAAFIFPLVVKCLLAAEKLYEMTASDAVHLDAFEALLEADLFVGEPHPWHSIIDESRMRRWVAGYSGEETGSAG